MRRFVVFLFLLVFSYSNSFSQLHLDKDYELNLGFEIIKEPSDSLLLKIFERAPELRQYLENDHPYLNVLKSGSNLVDINGDNELDLLVHIKGFWNGDGIEIYLSNNGTLGKVFTKAGNVTFISKETPTSPFYLTIVTNRYSNFPFLSDYTELTIYNHNGETIVNTKTTHFFEGTEFPEQITINKPFKVLQEKYNLRKTPLIDNEVKYDIKGNIILELTTGDTGIALAEKTDDTGRVWWFVKVQNNIEKPLDEFFYIDSKEEKYRIKKGKTLTINQPMFGWISSRFVKEIIN